ncbi:MAG: zinc ribbon domain-containing protein [Deltaproteobacteria bacterium]|nr:zinc ribbon domain-containing protein [Deltaproteobacteria bacterium]
MPIYSYECKNCMQDFDVIKGISEPEQNTCPLCGSKDISRNITAPNVICSRKSITPNPLVSDKLKPTGYHKGAPYYANPGGGLNAISYVSGRGYVEHPNLAGSPPGCDSKDGRVVLVKNEKNE